MNEAEQNMLELPENFEEKSFVLKRNKFNYYYDIADSIDSKWLILLIVIIVVAEWVSQFGCSSFWFLGGSQITIEFSVRANSSDSLENKKHLWVAASGYFSIKIRCSIDFFFFSLEIFSIGLIHTRNTIEFCNNNK